MVYIVCITGRDRPHDPLDDWFYFQEPVERRLGQTTRHICKGSTSYVKVDHDLVYDVPLLQSIQQQLSDDHILEEVNHAVTEVK